MSDSWEVVILVRESSISTVKVGEAVTIGVPRAPLSGMPAGVDLDS